MESEITRSVAEARPIALVAVLESIRQPSGSFEGMAAPTENVTIDLNVGESVIEIEGESLAVEIQFRLIVQTKDEESTSDSDAEPSPPAGEPCIEMAASFQLRYRVSDLGEYSQSTIAAFGTVNALFNAWPYMREFVQSSVRRAEYPPLVLPVLRIEEGQLVIGTGD